MEILLIILFVAAIIGAIYFRFAYTETPKTKGQWGEERIGMRLSSLPTEDYIVLNDLMFTDNGRTSQIDHLVVSEYGIFVIETKNYSGQIFGNTEKDYWTQNIMGNKFSLYNPVLQNKNHIKFLYSKFDVIRENIAYVHPIVAFLGMSRLEITGNNECVLWEDEVLGYITSFKEKVISKNVCEYIAVKLEIDNIHDKEERAAHNLNVRKTVSEYNDKLRNNICPRCGGRLVPRNGKYGSFYGCTNYPTCKYTINNFMI